MIDLEYFLSQGINVSRETLILLERYVSLVLSHQEKFNLIGPNTVEHIWDRHVIDSAQLIRYLPHSTSTIADFGSGAGFPGVVIAILTQHKVYCVESTQKKAQFLMHVADTLGLNVQIVADRIENLDPMNVDVVTARALAPLDALLKLSKRHLNKEGYMLFSKGESYAKEIQQCRQKWVFTCAEFESITNEKSRILRISGVKRKGEG